MPLRDSDSKASSQVYDLYVAASMLMAFDSEGVGSVNETDRGRASLPWLL